MTLKTLLLGSATAFAVVGGAQAADLSVAEPVDYVRICDAFGTGYWYIPGTDTCLAIHGSVEFSLNWHSLSNVYYGGTHSASWDFVTEAGLNFTAKSMTEFGELGAKIAYTAKYDNASASSPTVSLDNISLWVGPLTLGHTNSVFDGGGGYADSVYREDISVDQVALAWTMSGFGLALGIEDPRDRWGTSLGTSYSMPDIVAAATLSQGAWDAKVSAGFSQIAGMSVFGVAGNVTIKLDAIAAGDAVRFGGAFGTGASYVDGQAGALAATGRAVNGASNWSAYATFQHFFTSALSTAWSFGYLSNGTAGSWQAGGNLVWVPVTGLQAKIQGQYVVTAPATTGVWTGKVAVKRSF